MSPKSQTPSSSWIDGGIIIKNKMENEIHKWVDCEDGFVAEIFCTYDSETNEVLRESVIFSKPDKK